MFITYFLSVFVNVLNKGVQTFATIIGALTIGFFMVTLPYSIEQGIIARNAMIFIVWYGLLVGGYALSFRRCSETVVFFKYVNYLVLAVEDPKKFHSYDYGTEEGRQAIAFSLAKDARKGLRAVVETYNPTEINFTTHSKVLDILKRQKALAEYAYKETKTTQKSLKSEACVLNSLDSLKKFKKSDRISFNQEIVAKRTFHTGKFVKTN